jgi:adenine specific DNA methylase Mod
MRLVKIGSGAKFDIFAVNLSEDAIIDCPAKKFIEGLTPQEQKSLVNILNLHAAQGPIKNEQKSRKLRDGIFEFKTRQGSRVLYFYSGRRRTILSHGFPKCKPAELAEEIAKAMRHRALLEETEGR